MTKLGHTLKLLDQNENEIRQEAELFGDGSMKPENRPVRPQSSLNSPGGIPELREPVVSQDPAGWQPPMSSGVFIALLVTRTTFNVSWFMGMIRVIGMLARTEPGCWMRTSNSADWECPLRTPGCKLPAGSVPL